MNADLTSGLGPLDDLIDGVRIGDNLVVTSRGGTGLDHIVDRFVAARGERPLVVCTTTGARTRDPAPGVVVVDWSVPGAGDVAAAKQAVADADERVGGEALFAFDDLTGFQDAWGADAAFELFLWACPRLYRRRSVALWPVDSARHRPTFLRRLTDITQVVVDVTADDATLALEVVKADGRPRSTVGRRVRLDANSLEPLGTDDAQRDELGALIRRQRIEGGVAQAELARQVGITPSALSQLERGARGVSADTVTRIWEVLGVPFGPAAETSPGYRIARRGAQPPPESLRGLTRQRLATDPAVADLWRVTLAPGASGRGTPFAVKNAELVTVVRGVVDLEVGGHPETLHEGDTLTAVTSAITGWANPGTVESELHWAILRG